MKILILCLIFISLGHAKTWNESNSPHKLIKDLNTDFNLLPLKGAVAADTKLWPSYYWPYKRGGVGYRWGIDQNTYALDLLQKDDLLGLSRQEISQLSPIEKLDLINDNYKLTLTQGARKFSNPNAQDWNGICHGMAAASLHYPEPQIKTIINQDGLTIDLFTSDIKALLGYYYVLKQDEKVTQIGKRCFFNSRIMTRLPACKDVNAGAFHLLLANQIGLKKKSFLMDLERYKEVWNHGIVKFESEVIAQQHKRVKIRTRIYYPKTIEPHLAPIVGSSLDYIDSKIYTYWLEFDDDSHITGGSWVSFERPDFIWYQEKLELSGDFKKLAELLF